MDHLDLLIKKIKGLYHIEDLDMIINELEHVHYLDIYPDYYLTLTELKRFKKYITLKFNVNHKLNEAFKLIEDLADLCKTESEEEFEIIIQNYFEHLENDFDDNDINGKRKDIWYHLRKLNSGEYDFYEGSRLGGKFKKKAIKILNLEDAILKRESGLIKKPSRNKIKEDFNLEFEKIFKNERDSIQVLKLLQSHPEKIIDENLNWKGYFVGEKTEIRAVYQALSDLNKLKYECSLKKHGNKIKLANLFITKFSVQVTTRSLHEDPKQDHLAFYKKLFLGLE